MDSLWIITNQFNGFNGQIAPEKDYGDYLVWFLMDIIYYKVKLSDKFLRLFDINFIHLQSNRKVKKLD